MTRSLLFIPTLTAGGAERVASILANEWCRYPDTRTTVVTLFDEPGFYALHPEVELVCLGIAAKQGGAARAAALLRSLLALRREVLRRRPAFVLSFMNKYNVFCVVALLGTGVRVVAAERDSPTEVLPWIRVVLRKLTYPLAATVLVQSEAARAFILETTRSRNVQVLLNPVLRLVGPAQRQPARVVLNVSRLHPKKGQMDLLEAFAGLGRTDWTLALAGDGEMRGPLQARAQALGIADRVRFLGTVTDLRPLLATAGVFAFPSYWEGFPNALAEAMLAGIPCVSYDCPTGPAELIRHGDNGLLVPVGDVAGLRSALAQLLDDPALAGALGARAAEVAGKVEVGAVARQYWDACIGSRAAAGG